MLPNFTPLEAAGIAFSVLLVLLVIAAATYGKGEVSTDA